MFAAAADEVEVEEDEQIDGDEQRQRHARQHHALQTRRLQSMRPRNLNATVYYALLLSILDPVFNFCSCPPHFSKC